MGGMTKNKLSLRGIVALEPGKYCDGAGLWLAKTGLKSGKWFLRLTVHGKRREMGLSVEQPTSQALKQESLRKSFARTPV